MAIPEGGLSYTWVALCAVAVPAMLGLGLVRTMGLGPEHGRRVSWSFAYLTGHLALAGPTLGWVLTGRALPGVLLPVLAATLGCWLVRRANRIRAAVPPPRAAVAAWLPALLVILALSYDCLFANAEPVRMGDEVQIWAAKAHVLFGPVRLDSPLAFPAFVGHADYPLLDPLVQVLAFASAGRTLHFENRLPMQFFAIALLALLSAATTRRAHPLLAALALVAFAGTQFESGARTVAADVLVSFATLAAVEALLRLRETGDPVWWRLACVSFAAMLASKNEGALLALAVGGPFLIARCFERWRARPGAAVVLRPLVWLQIPTAVLLVQELFNRRYGLRNDLFDPGMGQGRGLFGRILHDGATNVAQVASYYGRMLVEPGPHRLLPLVFLGALALAAIAGRGRVPRHTAILGAVVVAAVVGFMLVFVGSHADLTWHLDTAAARTLQQIVPVAALGVCLVGWPRSAATSGDGTDQRQAASARAT